MELTQSGLGFRNKASSATQELDQLIASLDKFKTTNKPSNKSLKDCSNLDDMLINIKSDIDRQKLSDSKGGICFECDQPISNKIITAMGKTWHPEHFLCHHCNQELGDQSFFEKGGHAYCENDYQRLFSPKCAFCSEAIIDKCLTALNKTWHHQCFNCAICRKPFSSSSYYDQDDEAYCKTCYYDKFGSRCGGCQKTISDSYITFLNTQWHPECFVCFKCKSKFKNGKFFQHENKPYCELHYHYLIGSICGGCQKPITGRCLTAMSKKFHPEHFLCSFCLNPLKNGTFKEHGNKPYCHGCYGRLYEN